MGNSEGRSKEFAKESEDNKNQLIRNHPILDFEKDKKDKREVAFTFNGKELKGSEGDPILVALAQNGIMKLKEGAKKHTPYGPFCLQGRCCSCAMSVNGKPNVMSCVTPLEEGMVLKYSGDSSETEIYKRLPSKKIDISPSGVSQSHPKCDVAIIGGGPAGMEAAITLSKLGIKNIVLFDERPHLGGQLSLQTHTFFGTKELGASLRGFEIAKEMKSELERAEVDLRPNCTVVGLYPQNMLAFKEDDRLNFMMASKVLVATGASEKFMAFEGNCLPGVMGAGGAQTLMNLYGVRPGNKVLIIGGGNIGVILAYQLVQAGVAVTGIVEALNKLGAYEVHVKKIETLGIPIYTRHTIKEAKGKDRVESATVVALDSNWKIIPKSEKILECDTICLAVGLNPLNELLWQAECEFTYIPEIGEVPIFNKYRQTSNKDIFIAGDCAVIGEASIARLEGRIAALKIAQDLGSNYNSQMEVNQMLEASFELLQNIEMGTYGARLGIGKGKVSGHGSEEDFNFTPKEYHQTLTPADFKGKEKKAILSCTQDIPCNPCESSCHLKAITIGNQITQQPSLDQTKCHGCSKCIPVCPGRAIRVVQYNYSDTESAVTIPYEFWPYPTVGATIPIFGPKGEELTKGEVLSIHEPKNKSECGKVVIKILKDFAFLATSIYHPRPNLVKNRVMEETLPQSDLKKTYICRCEEVTLDEIQDAISQGYTTIHELKRFKRVGMGQCRGLSCTSIVEGILKREVHKSAEEMLDLKKHRKSIFRPPVKRVTLGEAAKLKFSREELQLFDKIEMERTIPQEVINKFHLDYFPFNSLKGVNQKTKIVIIGGGIGGIMTAWWLSQMGESDVIVLESNFLTSGKTGAALGGIRTGFNIANKVERAKKGLEVYKNAKTLIGEDIGWYQGGYVYLSFDEEQTKSFESSMNMWTNSKVPFTFTKEKSQFDRYLPGVDYSRVDSLVHFSEAGGANPFKATYHFAADAKKKGVKILTNQEVLSIQIDGGQVKGVVVFDKNTQSHHTIMCDHVVNAAGTSGVKVAKMVGIDLSDQIWIERHGAFITEKMPLWLDPLVVSYHSSLSGYWQQKRMESSSTEGELVACYSPSQPLKGYNTHSDISFLARMAKSILLCQPALSDVGIIRNFAEHYVGRSSGIPLIGPTPIKGFWLNIAKKGHGFMCAPGDGMALASSIIHGNTHPIIDECTIHLDSSSEKETMK